MADATPAPPTAGPTSSPAPAPARKPVLYETRRTLSKLRSGPRWRKRLSTTWTWLRGAWLTWRHLDDWDRFPAIWPTLGGRIRVRRERGARFTVRGGVLKLEGYLGSRTPSILELMAGSHLDIQGTFRIGDANRIKLDRGAHLEVRGAVKTPYSGILSYSTLAVFERMLLEQDVGIGSFCFVTDSDWHPMGDEFGVAPTVLEEHCILYDGCKVLKGVRIGAHTVVGHNAVVLSGTYPANSLVAGNPAKVVKEGIPVWGWDPKAAVRVGPKDKKNR